MSTRFDLDDKEWGLIEPLLPTDGRGKARVDGAVKVRKDGRSGKGPKKYLCPFYQKYSRVPAPPAVRVNRFVQTRFDIAITTQSTMRAYQTTLR
jgi:hypothetical protein